MARLRTRAHRSLFLAIALALLALLLEMNRFLPGTWSGGDEGGVRKASSPAPDQAEPGPESEVPSVAEDPASVIPPDAPPEDWPPKSGVLIEVRGQDGALETDWRLGVGDGGSEAEQPEESGTLRNRDRRVFEQGFRVRSRGRLVRHRMGMNKPATGWAVVMPRSDLPAQRNPAPIQLTVVDRATDTPIAGAEVAVARSDQAESLRTDARGRAALRESRRGDVVTIGVSAPGYMPQTLVFSARDPRPPTVTLDRSIDLVISFVASSGKPAAVTAGLVRTGEGRVLARFEGNTPTLRLGEADLADAWIEADVVVEPESGITFPVRAQLTSDSSAISVPETRIFEVTVRDPQGHAVAGAAVRASFQTREETSSVEITMHRPDGARTDASGRAYLAVPAQAPYAVLVEAPGAAGLVRRFQAGDGNVPLEVTVEPGLRVPVLVRGADGLPLAQADVYLQASVGGIRVALRASTGADGRATVGPLGAGPVEIFAWAPGHAWAGAVESAADAMGTVALQLARGHELRLIVEDPFGLPLADVRAEVTPADGGRPLVSPPREASWRSDAQGSLHIPDLPDRLYDVTLTLPGYSIEKIQQVRPGGILWFATLVRER